MNKTIRIVVVFAFLAALVAIGLNGSVWAGKLNAASQAPAGAPPVSRAPGTGETTEPSGGATGGAPIIIGSVASVQPYAGCTVYAVLFEDTLPAGFPADTTYPGALTKGTVIQLSSPGNNFCGAEVCYNVGPDSKEVAYYWDGSAWQTGEAAKDGLSCVIVPPAAPSPTFTGLFTPK